MSFIAVARSTGRAAHRGGFGVRPSRRRVRLNTNAGLQQQNRSDFTGISAVVQHLSWGQPGETSQAAAV